MMHTPPPRLLRILLREPMASLSAVVVVQFFCAIFFVSWVLAVRTPPGSPDESWKGSRVACKDKLDSCREYAHGLYDKIEKDMQKLCAARKPEYLNQLSGWLKAHPQQVFEVAQSIKHRWCKHTRSWKPDRTHYSKRLGQLVLRMDHVCPWINNVVGFRNYKYFFLMLFYAIVLLFAYVVAAILLLLHIAQIEQTYMVHLPFLHIPVGGSWDFWVSQGVFIFFCIFLNAFMSFYWLFQCQLVVAGLTAIEKKEKANSTCDDTMGCSTIPDNKLYVPSPWDLGFFRNVSSLLGSCFLLWPIPTTIGLGLDKPGAGTVFEIRKGHPMKDQDWDTKDFRTKTM